MWPQEFRKRFFEGHGLALSLATPRIPDRPFKREVLRALRAVDGVCVCERAAAQESILNEPHLMCALA
jgi:hypothetical protein